MRTLFSEPPRPRVKARTTKAAPAIIISSAAAPGEIRRVGQEILWRIVFEHLHLMQVRERIPKSRRRLKEMPFNRVYARSFTEADKQLFERCKLSDRDLKWLTKQWWVVQTKE